VRTRVAILLLAALPLAAADLAVKASVPTGALLYHHRSTGWELGSVALLAVLLLLVRLPSRLLAAAGGVYAAGLAGNLLSALSDGGRVPNPFVAGTLAFNLADVLLLGGLALLGIAGMRLAVRHRHVLPAATVPVRIGRYARARWAARNS